MHFLKPKEMEKERENYRQDLARPVNAAARPSIKFSVSELIRFTSLALNHRTLIKCSVRGRRRRRKRIYYAIQTRNEKNEKMYKNNPQD